VRISNSTSVFEGQAGSRRGTEGIDFVVSIIHCIIFAYITTHPISLLFHGIQPRVLETQISPARIDSGTG
jgi:hypothetical protein